MLRYARMVGAFKSYDCRVRQLEKPGGKYMLSDGKEAASFPTTLLFPQVRTDFNQITMR